MPVRLPLICAPMHRCPRAFPSVITLFASLVLALLAVPAQAESLSHGRFDNVQIYRPAGPVKQVALAVGFGSDLREESWRSRQPENHAPLEYGSIQTFGSRSPYCAA